MIQSCSCSQDGHANRRYAENLHDLKWLLVDLDGVLAEPCWPEPGIGKPIPEGVEFCRQRTAEGHKITVWTARPWGDYENVERWLDDHGVPHRRIICGKPIGDYFLDDRAVRPSWATTPASRGNY